MTHCYLRAMSPIHLKCKLRTYMDLYDPFPYNGPLHPRPCQHGRTFINVCVTCDHEARIALFSCVSGNCVESALSFTPLPQVVRVDGNSVDTKPIPRPSSREESTLYSRNLEGAISLRGSPDRGSGAKLRILSVEVGFADRCLTF